MIYVYSYCDFLLILRVWLMVSDRRASFASSASVEITQVFATLHWVENTSWYSNKKIWIQISIFFKKKITKFSLLYKGPQQNMSLIMWIYLSVSLECHKSLLLCSWGWVFLGEKKTPKHWYIQVKGSKLEWEKEKENILTFMLPKFFSNTKEFHMRLKETF